MKILDVVVLMWTVLSVILPVSCQEHRRSKRFAVFPRGGSFKIVIGVGIPIKIGSKQSMAIGWNFQAQYALATNITQLETYPPYYTRSVGKRELERSDRSIFYEGLEDILNSEGFNGRECLLRSICENAVDSLSHEANGIYGQILHIFFTPTYGDGEIEPDLDSAYLDAQKAGEYGVECHSLYPLCNMDNGFLDLFTVLESDWG